MKNKSKGIFFSVTEREKQKIKKNAALCGLNTSEYLRQRALGYAPQAVPSEQIFRSPSVFHLFLQNDEKLFLFCFFVLQ